MVLSFKLGDRISHASGCLTWMHMHCDPSPLLGGLAESIGLTMNFVTNAYQCPHLVCKSYLIFQRVSKSISELRSTLPRDVPRHQFQQSIADRAAFFTGLNCRCVQLGPKTCESRLALLTRHAYCTGMTPNDTWQPIEQHCQVCM